MLIHRISPSMRFGTLSSGGNFVAKSAPVNELDAYIGFFCQNLYFTNCKVELENQNYAIRHSLPAIASGTVAESRPP